MGAFGAMPSVCCVLWEKIDPYKTMPNGVQEKHLLWGLFFLAAGIALLISGCVAYSVTDVCIIPSGVFVIENNIRKHNSPAYNKFIALALICFTKRLYNRVCCFACLVKRTS